MKKNNGSVSNVLVLGIVLLFVVVFGIITAVAHINQFRAQDETVNAAWAQVNNQLQRRYDLIPNLVNSVKGYAGHESKVLEGVARARAGVGQAQAGGDMGQRIKAEGELSQALGRLIMVTESYPQLKADKHFTQLMDELACTENQIAVARMDYNDAAKIQNLRIRTFPASLFVGMAGVERRSYFENSAEFKDSVKVQF